MVRCVPPAVRELGRCDEPALAADLHRREAFVPGGDYAAGAELELERGPVRIEGAIEEGAVRLEPPGVLGDDGLPGLGRCAGARLDVDVLEAAGRRDRLAADLRRTWRRVSVAAFAPPA